MKKTKDLLKELNERSAFWLAWAILWRVYVISFGIGAIYGLLTVIFTV